ncbi:MAG: UDP-3-O-(3-hydroxymyristoyl)glucosamine N-acyltransferase [Sphingobacteriia bacterium]|nr:UDP-3-O-(3-hydroxymyristoyl)glucosamine N-acyltransferase [Sphingobacteriia bacterium]
MKFTAEQIATLLGGIVEGEGNLEVSRLAKIEQGVPGAISFLANPKYIPYIYETDSSVVLVNKDFIPDKPIKATLIRVEDAYTSFTKLLEMAEGLLANRTGQEDPNFIHPSAEIGENTYIGAFVYIGEQAKIGKGAKIYPFTYIDSGVEIGEDSILKAGVKVLRNCIIGNRCILHAGVVIGSDGFGFAPQKDGQLKKIPQTGIVRLEDEVEIGANTCIDRATLGETLLKQGAKIDNLVQIAHNVEIGQHTAIASQTGISGSTKIGKYCLVGGQVGFVGHLSIADRTQIGGQSGISKNVESEGLILRGSPAQPIREQLRTEALLKQLEAMYARIQELEKKVANLSSQ